jgi:hypothetical protein
LFIPIFLRSIKSVIPIFCLHRVLFITFRDLM